MIGLGVIPGPVVTAGDLHSGIAIEYDPKFSYSDLREKTGSSLSYRTLLRVNKDVGYYHWRCRRKTVLNPKDAPRYLPTGVIGDKGCWANLGILAQFRIAHAIHVSTNFSFKPHPAVAAWHSRHCLSATTFESKHTNGIQDNHVQSLRYPSSTFPRSLGKCCINFFHSFIVQLRQNMRSSLADLFPLSFPALRLTGQN